jgi:hypothetical protein
MKCGKTLGDFVLLVIGAVIGTVLSVAILRLIEVIGRCP